MMCTITEWQSIFKTKNKPNVGDNCYFGNQSQTFKVTKIDKSNVTLKEVMKLSMVDDKGLKSSREFFIE